ncbi:chlorohydrolase [Methanocaldococcus villosus KIN24-T80]|uniref:Chlorohydrolase n=1 Tax=Methanocaldococcus villosus KIN24-T80 TaxID=1069083 RepID=N6VZS2_9EURY|nr:amidohydrolase family protein [Methanocaldococcus villosus]ENN96572.1 chlorohydrolase [Methanocaldococcus villosus KIN24-T80]
MIIRGKFLYGEDFTLREGNLVIEEGIIKGFTNEREDIKFNGLIIPSIINAHTHIADNCIKDIGINKDLDELVKPPNGLKHKYLKILDDNIIIKGIRLAIDEMVSLGIRYFCDFREGGLKGVKLLRKALNNRRIKAIILGRPINIDVSEIEKILFSADGIGLSGANEYNDEELKIIYNLTKKYNKIFSIHVAEHRGAVEYSIEKYGKTELKRLLELNIKPDFIIHGTHLSDEDIYLLKEKNIPTVLCVRANLYFNVGMPNIKKLMENEIMLGIGSDNFMANSPSIFREMEFIYKLYHIEPKEILKMATINNAKILKLENVGLIDEGYKADLTFIKPTNAILFSKNIVASLMRVEKGDIINIWWNNA